MKEWSIQGQELANCNCNFGCPCQFSQPPSHGTCEAAVIYDISKGHYGDVKLDGLRAAGVYKWPGAIHEGEGHMQLIIEDRATGEQRAALESIMTGKDTDEMATMWYVFSAMCPHRHETLSAPISVDIDIDARTGRGRVDGVFELSATPIPHVVTGEPHRISITLPNGFEFSTAEMACGSARTDGGDLELSNNDATHAHLARLHLTGSGVVRA